ncbi:Tat pathway signal sequence domain protein [Caulobacter sp.]|uniref:Tat pathway signal sequence domain protein n=1 Tax=Caulobacter sp. TaxID=78 RepID=UPI003BAD8B6D
MRRNTTLALSAFLALSVAATATVGHAQSRGRGGQEQGQGGDDEQAGKKKKRDEEWNQPKAPLPQLRNAGPCPYVKVLYDASRFIEFKDGKESPSATGFTGEVQGISSGCAYKSDDPINLRVEILFQLGRGPQAAGSEHTYRYWVAVTERNQAVIAKEYFDLPITFPAGQDRVFATETLNTITIPRADAKVSGGNFEVLVGFDVTPEMAAFNREGKRFRVNAGQTAQAGTATKQ